MKKAMSDNNGYSLLAADEQNVKAGTDAINACKDEDANVLNRHFNPDACEKGVLPEQTDEESLKRRGSG